MDYSTIGGFLGLATTQTLIALAYWRATGRERAVVPALASMFTVQAVRAFVAMPGPQDVTVVTDSVIITVLLIVALALYMRRKGAPS